MKLFKPCLEDRRILQNGICEMCRFFKTDISKMGLQECYGIIKRKSCRWIAAIYFHIEAKLRDENKK